MAELWFKEETWWKNLDLDHEANRIEVAERYWLLLCTVAIFGMSLLKSVASLRYGSLFATASMVFLAICIDIRYFIQLKDSPFNHDLDPIEVVKFDIRLFVQAWGLFLFAYTAHWMVLPVYSELQLPSLRRIATVCRRTNMFACFLYSTSGILAYLTWRSCTQSNILLSFKTDDVLIQVGRFAITSSLLVGTAINQMAARDMIESVLFKSKEPSFLRRFIETVCILVTGIGPALLIDDAGPVLGLVGSVMGAIIGYILPSMLFLKVGRPTTTERIGGWAILIIGICVAIVGAIATFVPAKLDLPCYCTDGDFAILNATGAWQRDANGTGLCSIGTTFAPTMVPSGNGSMFVEMVTQWPQQLLAVATN